MKKKLFLRLCLMMIALLSLDSCRQDLLPDQETHNNSSAFQLTSKRISLNEAKHKAKLLLDIEQVETKFKTFSTSNAQGKIISYGNGISIDTEDVIYIENGSNYHTYTFNITRDNALPTDPVENLVLTPLADGSYKELLVTYNLSPQQKNALMMGASVDTKGKTTVTELAKGSYNSGGQLARFNCGYQSTTIWVNCCHNGFHNPTNVDDWANCVCPPEGQPNVYTVVSHVCSPVFETITPIDPGGSSGGGGGGGGNTPCTVCPAEPQTPTEPCNGNGVLTGPFDPILSPGDGGCGGVVTLPTLPVRNNPCEKTKATLAKQEMQTNINDLYAQSKITDPATKGEKAFKLNADGSTTSPIIVGDAHSAQLGNITGYTSFYHNHTPKGVKIHSPPDIYMLFQFIAAQPPGTPVGSSFGGMVSTNVCASNCPDGYEYGNFIIRFNGTRTEADAIKNRNYTEADLKVFTNKFGKFEQEIRPKSGYSSQNGNFLSFKGLEEVFFYALGKMNIDKNKIILQRIDKDGTIYNITLDVDGKPIETPCP